MTDRVGSLHQTDCYGMVGHSGRVVPNENEEDVVA